MTIALVMFACAFVAIRVALPGFSVSGLSLGRLMVASTLMAIAAPFLGVRIPSRAHLVRIVGCGLAGMAGYQVLLNAGERTVPAGTASMLVNTGPIFAAVLAFVLLSERIGRRGWIGIALGFVGAVTITFAQGASLRPSADALLVLAAALAQSTYFVVQKPLLAHYSGFEVTCYATWVGALVMAPTLPGLLADLPAASGGSIAAVVFLGIGPSAVGYATWAYAQARLPVATVTNTLFLVPFLSIGIGWVVLDESIHLVALAGGLIALGGVALSRRGGRSRR
ncbi:DMT family transporter [Actinosynnema sp. ALI-1.44]|uniref:DMT family transporter n=1 Tax=Actinosynnema sp. ALI-1.44 TaxID=1933779 RepID=UPI00143D4240|nr:DMT family transporter [Actinosynnema sp. ALI-1.44]